MAKLSKTDVVILRAMQRDANASNEQIGQLVSRDASVVSRRIGELARAGLIIGVHAALNPLKIGLPTTVYTLVSLKAHTPDLTDPFEAELDLMPNVVEWARISGSWDYLLKFVVCDTPQHDRLHARLLSLPMVSRLRGMHVKGQPRTRFLPLDHLE